MVALSTRIPTSLHKRLRRTALDADVQVQQAVAEAVEDWLAKNEG